jgi:hypothetical protein
MVNSLLPTATPPPARNLKARDRSCRTARIDINAGKIESFQF